MIVVGILSPNARAAVGAVARRAAAGATPGAANPRVEVVGVASDRAEGDGLLLGFASAGVGHATVTRSPAPTIEPADLELALRYLPDVRVIVVVAPDAALLRVAVAGSSWSGATLVIVGPLDQDAANVIEGSHAMVLEPPEHDPDESFAGLVAAFARRVDAGDAPATAWGATLAALAVDPA